MASKRAKGLNNAQGSARGASVLRGMVQTVSQECKPRLGFSASDIEAKAPTVDVFFDAIAAERLRRMPPDGSRLDGALRRASRLSFAVASLRDAVVSFMDGANDASKLIWGSTLLLLENGIEHVDVLDSVFGRYGSVTLQISLLLQQEGHFRDSNELQTEVARIYASLLQLVLHVTMEHSAASRTQDWVTMGENVDASFFRFHNSFNTNCRKMSELSLSKRTSIDIAAVYQFLDLQDRPLQMILEGHNHSLADGSFGWFDPHLTTFTLSNREAMMVTGDPGAGKSALAQWTIERLQVSSEYDSWNVIPYWVRDDVPITTLTLTVLKGLLLQMLDRCVSSWKTQEAIIASCQEAAHMASRGGTDSQVEDVLWSAIHTALQSHMHFMVVLDGLDQIQNSNTSMARFLSRLQSAISGTPSKLIIFSRNLPAQQQIGRTTQHLSMTPALTENDMLAAVAESIGSDGEFYGLDAEQIDSLAGSIVTRARGSFVWAQLTLEYMRRESTFKGMLKAIQQAPTDVGDLIDSHLNTLDLSRLDTRSLLAWLVAAERPLRIREVDELLKVDPQTLKFGSRPAGPDRAIYKPLGRLVMVRDGFVAFRHPMIREDLRLRAESADSNYSSNRGFPFNLEEAHYDILTRSLAWTRLSVKQEVDVSMDKLPVQQRDALFDSYILLEYTSRYWFSHLLSSPMTTPDHEFAFTPLFKKSLPESVLFTQIELTSREAEFSRSSILELYRLSVAVRRAILGEKSKAFLQSLILSARASDLAETNWANDHMYEAWNLSRSQLGHSSPITTQLEQLLVNSPRRANRGDQIVGMKADAIRDMAMSDWDSNDLSFKRRLEYLGTLIQMYQSNNQNEEAYSVSKQFYRQTLNRYGSHSKESAQAADFLTQHFQISPSDDLSLEISHLKYENMMRSMDATDARRIAYSLYLAQLYEENGKSKQAESILTSLWAGVSSHDLDTQATWEKKTKVAFVYYQFLRRHGRYEEAKLVLRELSSDLESDGIHTDEMADRAKELSSEAHELGLIDMERTLDTLVWKYYVSSGKQYSSDAVTLARNLSAVEMSRYTTVDDLAAVSEDERLFLRSLMDTLASSGSGSQSTSLLTLCHNLCSVYITKAEWKEGSDCAWSVLKHEWPDVHEPTSESRFRSDRAPLIANVALDYAFCLFRRLDVQTATAVYGNAFKASITAEKVAIPHITAVVKTVVEFYETTFQFSKALVLLHQVSEFFISRLGDSDKHTIDTLYYEGDLAARLDRQNEAEAAYRHIYKASIHGATISSTGVPAAVALVGIYEKQNNATSALDVYRHLWPTMIRSDKVNDSDRSPVGSSLDKTYTGYMSTLGSGAEAGGYTERYTIASQYLAMCQKVHGRSSNITRDATINLADICADSESHIDQAISLYHSVLTTDAWVPQSQASLPLPDMTDTLGISIKHKLAEMYLRKKSTSSEAYSLYMEELTMAKQQHGLSSSYALVWLRQIALLYAAKGTVESRRQGSKVLHDYVDETIHITAGQDTLVERAHRLGETYLSSGYTDAGNELIDELHQQVIHETPAAQRSSLSEHRPAVFVAAFEEVFRKKLSYGQILDQLSQESRVVSDFQKSLSGHDLMPTLVAGDRLSRLQSDQKRTSAAKTTQDSLYEYFCNTLSISPSLRSKNVVRQFYYLCCREASNPDYSINITTATTGMVRDLCNKSLFQEAADLTGVFHSFAHLTDGLRSHEAIFTAIKLCLYLNGYQTNKCSDPGIAKNMGFESQMLLEEILNNARELKIEFSDLPFGELNDLVTVLGEHEMFDDLEAILTDLWTSRIVQKTWSLNVVVWIGRRLVETRFCRGRVHGATRLGKDICYNLRQVWGNCDPVTLEMNKLLSGLYTASGNYLAAVALHETALYELLNDPDVDKTHAADTVSQHLQLLKHAQTRLSREGSHDVDESAYDELVQLIATKFGIRQESLQHGDYDDDVGMWQRPRRFSLDVEEQQMHSNHLRNSSGSALLNGNAGAKRISITAL
ncbi:NACHT domain protein [Aspergillus clavatus NRRL 1]|uniref:NACHT domain protein n=1 Tax=Aspergillus clavatus (strain ATCC 1007 / CBS 513.65 / DSM 816 / NCTC 3887 / NRRL 1 / QM 1276 / 107) TaxID=344612 RepID=A1CSE2_ASPCL|nr:NACHT domain protein [Aspergillus clavatus NRRL 1]EAW08563.1 NACHT domain protein [Aspergillus clavatus NRRL 1]